MSKQDIDAIINLLDQVQKLGVAGKLILKDGKVDLQDLPQAVALLSEVNDFIAAAKRVGEAYGEAKDLDSSEGLEVVRKMYEVGKAIEVA